MMDCAASFAGAANPPGPAAPNAVAPKAAAKPAGARAGKADTNFEDRLDATLAAAEDTENAAAAGEEPAAGPRRSDDARDLPDAMRTRADNQDDEAETFVVGEAPKQGEPPPLTAPVFALPAFAELRSAEAAVPETGKADAVAATSDVEEATDPMTDAQPAGRVAAGATRDLTTANVAVSSPRGHARTASLQKGDSPIRMSGDGVATTAVSTSAAPSEATPVAQADIEVPAPPRSTEAQSAAPVAEEPEDARAATTATIVAPTEAAFDPLTGDRHNQRSRQDAPAADPGSSIGPVAHEGAKAPTPQPAMDARTAAGPDAPPAQPVMVTLPSRPADGETVAALESTLHAYEPTPAADTSERIVHSLRMQFQRGGGDAIVHIKPEHLGPLTISLRVEQGTVSARVTADNAVVAEWLQANEHTLRDGLKSNGLQLDRLVITRDQDPSSRTPYRESPDSQRQRRRFTDTHSTFELTA